MALLSEFRSVWAEANFLLHLIVVRSQIAHKTKPSANLTGKHKLETPYQWLLAFFITQNWWFHC